MRKIAAIGAGITFGFWDFCLKKCAGTGTHALLGAATMELTGGFLLLLTAFLVRSRYTEEVIINQKGLFWGILGGTCLAIADSLYFFALEKLQLSQAGVIYAVCEFSMVIILGLIILHDVLTPLRVAGLCFGGLAIVLLNWN